jgi:Cellulase (glycosyl hydrolase family 5)
VIAMIIPISTNTTIATCVQIQNGDTARQRTWTRWASTCALSGHRDYLVVMAGRQLTGTGFPRTRMTARPLKLFLALALGLCAFAWLTAAGRADRVARAHVSAVAPLGGMNIAGVSSSASLTGVDREIALAHALHAKVVRTAVPWSTMEPGGPGQIDPRALAIADRLVSDAAADNIKVIVLADSTPCWASSAPASLLNACVPGISSKANAWPPANPATYATFVAYLAQRYGTRLAAIEVWNEPDQANQDYFAGPEKPQRYATVLRAAYPAIKQANPNVPVLAGSLVGANGVFLRALYAAGIKGYYDGLAMHFYTLTLASLRSIHEVQVANGDTKPLWLDEFGWSSCWPRYKIQQEQACVTAQTQALNITNTFRSLASTSYIAAEVLYQLEGSVSENFGAVNANGTHKPAFATLSKVFTSPFGPVSPVTLSLRKRAGRVLASGSGPVGDYMELEAFRGSTLRYRALFVLNRFNRFSIKLPAALGTSGLRVRVYQYWAGLGRAAQRSI